MTRLWGYGWGHRGYRWGHRALPSHPYTKGLNGKDFVPAELKLTDLAKGTGI
jgi:hypothetical protein